MLRLSRTGRAALAELRAGPVRSDAAGRLARKLTDTGLAHPRPPELASQARRHGGHPGPGPAVLLDRCLSALGDGYPVLVVDDGSEDPGAVADVAAAHGAALVRREVNGGPGAARNTGLLSVATDLVAFLDSDCVPEPGWIERLAAHLADPAVAAAAPRMVAVPAGPGWAGRYTTAACCLDLGDAEARVVPGTRVAYVPTAALVVRRAAIARGAGAGRFDPALRWGEDVDLVWRLHEAGWRIRYDPAVRVSHHEPDGWAALLARRFRYGTSAAPLAMRHPGQVPPLVLHPWPAVTVAGLLAGRPAMAGLSFTGSVLAMRRAVQRAGLPARGVVPAMLDADPADLAGHRALCLPVRHAGAGRRAGRAGRDRPGATLGPAGRGGVTAARPAADGLVHPPPVAGPGPVRARPPGRRRGLRRGSVGGCAARAQHGPGPPDDRLAPVPRRPGRSHANHPRPAIAPTPCAAGCRNHDHGRSSVLYRPENRP